MADLILHKKVQLLETYAQVSKTDESTYISYFLLELVTYTYETVIADHGNVCVFLYDSGCSPGHH